MKTARAMQMASLLMLLAGATLGAQATNAQPGDAQATQPADPASTAAPAPTPAPVSSAAAAASPREGLPALPPAPAGKTTIVGGAIRSVDSVRDQFELSIRGQQPMKILFDERTLAYRDGVKFPVDTLGRENYASVQTVLDGDKIFAVSIHVLSHSPEGACEGRVLSYNANRGELVVSCAGSPEAVTLFVPADASIVRAGEPTFASEPSGRADLVPGAIVSADFEPGTGRADSAGKVTVLAVPGASFVFSGNLSYVDMHTGQLLLLDPRDGRSYQILFRPSDFAVSGKLQPGTSVTIKARYDGTTYVASDISLN
jgi:hypothetical protein